MRWRKSLFFALILFFPPPLQADTSAASARIVWASGPHSGDVEVDFGQLSGLHADRGTADGARFEIPASERGGLVITVSGARLDPGAFATLVQVQSSGQGFTFFLRDVSRDTPIYIPEYGVAVTRADDLRSYVEIEAAIRARGLVSDFQRYDMESEESYAAACRRNRNQVAPTWLGLSRDMRTFRVHYSETFGYWGNIEPFNHATPCPLLELSGRGYSLGFAIGHGAGPQINITRRLDEGMLPILHSLQDEGDVDYQLTLFATLERQPLGAAEVRGSDWRAVYPNTSGQMLSREEVAALHGLMAEETVGRDEEVVLFVRVEAVNRGKVPRYAWFKAPAMSPWAAGSTYSSTDGTAMLDSGRVFCVNRLDGRPMPQEEMAVLLQPGQSTTLDMRVPHQPVSMERAERIAAASFEAHLAGCRAFWQAKLANAARIHVPEPAIQERLYAGLLHCDLVAYGTEPDGPVLPTIGVYSPIGSESAPIIQFFDTMGWPSLAERAIEFFLLRQREDGFIQNFGGYQLETGPVLWSMGEHFRYGRDTAWVQRVRPNILRASDYLIRWRERNKTAENRERGCYGLIDGKVADPEDYYHSFMLNAVSCLGVERAAEMLTAIGDDAAPRLAREAEAWKADIRTAFDYSMARAPVIPVGDGRWTPLLPPCTEDRGGTSLHALGGMSFSHGAISVRDALLGPLWLVTAGILDANSLQADFLLKSNQAPFTVENAALSQPYYCRHDYAHLLRGEVKPFLKTYYNQMTALQDRETYTFWEHYYHISSHKTHEEAWFLWQTRWMLCMEQGTTLHLLRGIPRDWMGAGKRIEIDGLRTWFGPLSLRVKVADDGKRVEAEIDCPGPRRPATVRLRIPHPAGRHAVSVEGGEYVPAEESVVLADFTGHARLVLEF